MAFHDVSRDVQAIVDRMMSHGRRVEVLEAGCGSRSHIRLGRNAHVVGIDISEDQLQANSELDERIVGDIQTFPLAPSTFDVVFCWDVLEHLQHPEAAIENLFRAVRGDGIVVLGAPVVNSLKGTITKLTPLWFHIFVFRYLMGNKNAGKKGHGPFPTLLKKSMSPGAIARVAREKQMHIEQFTIYQDQMEAKLRKKHWTLDLAFGIVKPFLRIVSFGKIDPDVTDFVIVLRKPLASTVGSRTVPAVAHIA